MSATHSQTAKCPHGHQRQNCGLCMTERSPAPSDSHTRLSLVLDEIEEYLEQRADVRDGSDRKQLPNDEMTLLDDLRQARLSETRPTRDDVLEEAAKVADGFNYFYPETARTSQGQTAVAISVAIRDLKNAAPQPGNKQTARRPGEASEPAESASPCVVGAMDLVAALRPFALWADSMYTLKDDDKVAGIFVRHFRDAAKIINGVDAPTPKGMK